MYIFNVPVTVYSNKTETSHALNKIEGQKLTKSAGTSHEHTILSIDNTTTGFIMVRGLAESVIAFNF